MGKPRQFIIKFVGMQLLFAFTDENMGSKQKLKCSEATVLIPNFSGKLTTQLFYHD